MNRKLMLACLTDRPCAVCKYHSDNGCTQWKCVFEEQPCEDAISRHATLEPYKVLNDTDTLCVALIRANIMQQPPVTPQQKVGMWIKRGQDIYCSICNNESAYNPFGASKFSKYCPNCGSLMQEE